VKVGDVGTRTLSHSLLVFFKIFIVKYVRSSIISKVLTKVVKTRHQKKRHPKGKGKGPFVGIRWFS
jgi:hypothetical protein